MIKALATIKYDSVVFRETVRIALMFAALNDLEVKMGNILNACVRHQLQKKYRPLWVLSLVKMPERLK